MEITHSLWRDYSYSCLFLFMVFLLPTDILFGQEGEQINWITFEKAMYEQKFRPQKKIMVYIYFSECVNCEKELKASVKTDKGKTPINFSLTGRSGCGFCDMMNRKTWTSPKVIALVNKYFHAVALDASSLDTISFLGQKYYSQPIPNPNNEVRNMTRNHGLVSLLNNSGTGYPGLVFLDEKNNRLSIDKGMQSESDVLKRMKGIVYEEYDLGGTPEIIPLPEINLERQKAIDYFVVQNGTDKQRAYSYFKAAYEKNEKDFYTQMWMAYLLDKGLCGFKVDKRNSKAFYKASLPALKNALGRDNGEAFFLWGLINVNRDFGDENDWRVGVQSLKLAGEAGFIPGIHFYAYYMKEEKFYTEAMKYFKMAGEKGMPIGFYQVGMMYQKGLGVKVNQTKAASWFDKACKAGLQEACN